MNKKLLHRLVAHLHIFILLVPLFCLSSSYADSDTIIIIPSMEKKSVSLSVSYDATIKLRLTTNMGTGYDWVSLTHDIKSHLIKTDQKKSTGNSESREFQIPRFEKNAEYIFVYKRTWEKKSEDEKRFKLIIKSMD